LAQGAKQTPAHPERKAGVAPLNVPVLEGRGVVEEVETPPGSCPQGCGFASVALRTTEMRSPSWDLRAFCGGAYHVQCDSTS